MVGDMVAFNTKWHRAQLRHVHRLRWIISAARNPEHLAMERTGKRTPRAKAVHPSAPPVARCAPLGRIS
jgi:hypothetical protein